MKFNILDNNQKRVFEGKMKKNIEEFHKPITQGWIFFMDLIENMTATIQLLLNNDSKVQNLQFY